MYRLTPVLLVGILLFCGMLAHKAEAVTQHLSENLQRELENGIEALEIPGAVLMIESETGDSWSGAAGVAQYPDEAMTTDLNFYIGSVTKSLTATIILQLVDEGLLELDEPLENVLPGIVVNASNITIRHLLEMRSGLGNYSYNETFLELLAAEPLRVWTPEELIAYSNEQVAEPDTVFTYNNANYILLGMIIEEITGNSFAENVSTRIVAPLGLERTYVPDSPTILLPHAHGYTQDGGTWRDFTDGIDPSSAWAAGSVISTPAETVRWVKALVEGELISSAMQTERLNFLPASQNGGQYGLGIMDWSGAVGHNGDYNTMFTSWATKYKGWYIALLCNGRTPDGDASSSAAVLFWYIANRVELTQPVALGGPWLEFAFFSLLVLLGIRLIWRQRCKKL